MVARGVMLLLFAATAVAAMDIVTFGAGTSGVNGLWETSPHLYNDAPQFLLKHAGQKDGKHYEMFLYTERPSNESWWNIQEVEPTPEGGLAYGKVLYSRYVNVTLEGRQRPPQHGWQNSYQIVLGQGPPTVAVVERTTSIADCDNDDCVEYYFRQSHPMFTKGSICRVKDASNECMCAVITATRDIPAEEIQRCRADWLREGIVSIPNILLPEIMEAFVEELRQYKHSYFWYASFWDDVKGEASLVARSPANEPYIRQMLEKQWFLRCKNRYAYSFTRTSDRVPFIISQLYWRFYEYTISFLQSNQMRNTLKAITGNDYEMAVFFFSRYTPGDFLDPHSDSVATRKIAYTLHFTEDWHMTFGGMLMILTQEDWKTIRRAVVPTFNTLTFFDVSRERFIIPHYVTEIVQGVDHPRVALTGWYQYKGGEEPYIEKYY